MQASRWYPDGGGDPGVGVCPCCVWLDIPGRGELVTLAAGGIKDLENGLANSD